MIFRRLELRNFLSFERASFNFARRGLFLILGEIDGSPYQSNGAGKSAIVEGLMFALFNETIRPIKINDVIRRGTGRAEVELEFETGGRRFKIIRSRDAQFGGSVKLIEFTADGQAVELSENRSATAVNRDIVELIGFSAQVMRNSICHPQGLPYRFIQASDVEKKELFEEILHLEWIAQLRQRASLWHEKAFFEKMKAERELSFLQGALEELEARLNELQERLPSDGEQNLNLRAVQTSLKAVERKLASLEAEKAETTESLAELLGKVGVRDEESLLDKLFQLQTFQAQLEAKLSTLSSQNESLKGAKVCPTCRRPMREADFKSLMALQEKEAASLRPQLEATIKKISTLTSTLQSVRQLGSRLQAISDEINLANSEKSALLKRLVDAEGLERLISEIEAVLEQRQQKLNTLFELETRCRALQAQLEVADWLKTIFGPKGLKARIVDSVLPLFVKEVNSYFSRLGLGASFEASIEGEPGREKLLTTVEFGENRLAYEACSGGERRRMDVAVLLALNSFLEKVSCISTNLLIFDEVFENLDLESKASLVELLKEQARSKAIYIISHDSSLSDFIPDIIKVVKRQGVSTIEN